MDKNSEDITEFIDITILNTPKPRASSTVQRNGVYSYRPDETNATNGDFENIKSNNHIDMDVPTRDIDTQSDSSHRTSVSSLGILSMDNIEDIKEILLTKNDANELQRKNRKSNVNETLAMQRILAQRAMEKVDSKTKRSVGGLPSYLLKPTQTGTNNTIHTATPTKNESTINLSDLERSLPQKISNASNAVSFEVKEISARSSSLGNQNDKSYHLTSIIDLRSPSPVRGISSDFAVKYQDICEQLRQSDASLTAFCDHNSRLGMNTQPLGALSVPDIDTVDLSSTCASWTNVQQDSLVAKLQNELFTPAELVGEKLLADEMSWRKTKDMFPTESYSNKVNSHLDMSCFSGYIGDDDISLQSRINGKVSISEFFKLRSENVDDLNLKSSPEKKHDPVPLLDRTSSTTTYNEPSEVIFKEKESRMSTCSIPSKSQIGNILDKMDTETPTKILTMLLKKSNQNNINTPSTISSDGSTLKNTFNAQTLSPNISSNDRLKENSYISSSMNSPRRSNNEAVLRDMTNLQHVHCDNEWNGNGTVSSVAESPSYSCSELEFSDDERTPLASTFPDECLHIDNCKSYKVYVNISENLPIALLSKTNHWLHVKLTVKDIISHNLGDNIVKVDILNKDGVLKPFVNEHFFIKVNTLEAGKFQIVIQFEVTNIVTKSQQIIDHVLIIESVEPQIKVLSETLDFKLNPERAIKRLPLSLVNESAVPVSISLTIIQKYECAFVFGSDDEFTCQEDNKVETVITISPGSTMSVPVEMQALELDHLGVSAGVTITSVTGILHVQLENSTKILQKVFLTGRVGFTKIQFNVSHMPFVFQPGQTKPMQVRNSGVVPLDLSVAITLPEPATNPVIATDNLFTIDTTSIVLKPGQVGTVNITFNAKDKLRPVKRIIRLDYPRGPDFALPIEGVMDACSPDVKFISSAEISPRLDRPGSGSSGGSSHSSASSLRTLPDGKLPIESTRTELVWGCVRLGRNNIQNFVLRNRCSQRVRFQAIINGSQAFKFMKEQSENTSSLNLLLYALESRTISVLFCPNSKGAASARLMFLPIEQDTSHVKRQMIQLYGYGGYTLVDVQKVAKDSSGRMWLSFGHLDYRDTLHQRFILRNTGSLTAFACLSVICKVLYPFMDSRITILPTEAVIEPNKEIEISLNFNPQPEDFKYIPKSAAVDVSEIASIKIMTGPEPTRARIRRLFNKLNSNNSSGGIVGQLTSAFVVPRLSGVFPGENIPSDVTTCRESGGALRDLLQDIDTRDLILTVERTGADCTEVGADLDDTLMFQSLAVADNTIVNVTGRTSGGFCSVEPRCVTISPAEQKVVLVRSHHSRPMPFEVFVPASAADSGLQVTPLIGVLSPGDVATVTVFCTSTPNRTPYTCVLMIYVENEVMEIELKIQNTPVLSTIKNE